MDKKLNILVTGGTGSIGGIVVDLLEKDKNVEKIISLSRKEMAISYKKSKQSPESKTQYYCSDILDFHSLSSFVARVDLVIHTAASKFVDVSNDNVWSTINNNIIGSNNVLLACQTHGKDCILTSTDKACEPQTVMGATKFLMERLAMDYADRNPNLNIRLARFGNVFGSYGSVVHKFIGQTLDGVVCKLTNPEMTRFMITRRQVKELFYWLIYKGKSKDIASYAMKSLDLKSLAIAFKKRNQNFLYELSGIRESEKMEEKIFTAEEYKKIMFWNPEKTIVYYNTKNTPILTNMAEFDNDSDLSPKYSIDEIHWLIEDAHERLYKW